MCGSWDVGQTGPKFRWNHTARGVEGRAAFDGDQEAPGGKVLFQVQVPSDSRPPSCLCCTAGADGTPSWPALARRGPSNGSYLDSRAVHSLVLFQSWPFQFRDSNNEGNMCRVYTFVPHLDDL